MPKETYTLAAAKAELNRRECDRRGHDFDVISTLAGPQEIICGNCGWSGTITMNERL